MDVNTEKSCRCGGKMAASSYAHEVVLDKRTIRVPPIPGLACAKCGDITISLAELGRCEMRAAVTALTGDLVSGSTVRFSRRAIGVPRDELAANLGVDPALVEEWETGETEFDLDNQQKLAELIEFTLNRN